MPSAGSMERAVLSKDANSTEDSGIFNYQQPQEPLPEADLPKNGICILYGLLNVPLCL